jgi:sterol desaturase/sphingolipid hydroxylase (fatty acid hydroxylase superfamily)
MGPRGTACTIIEHAIAASGGKWPLQEFLSAADWSIAGTRDADASVERMYGTARSAAPYPRMPIAIVLLIGAGFILVERIWPANALPRVRAWYPRVFLVNALQAGIVVLAGLTWDQWLKRASLIRLEDHLDVVSQALVAYVVSSFVYYWWHRWRHTSQFWWNVCHQLHHSARRIEILTSFYKHPVEIALNSILSAAITYTLLGISIRASMLYTFLTAVAEFFYHWNVRTLRWLGPIVQRPESHRVHHRRSYHTNNYADLPIFDIMFGTYENPGSPVADCGFTDDREETGSKTCWPSETCTIGGWHASSIATC